MTESAEQLIIYKINIIDYIIKKQNLTNLLKYFLYFNSLIPYNYLRVAL